MSWPPIPSYLEGLADEDMTELWNKLVTELLDADYSGRTHGSRRTAEAGCGGPVCRKGVRLHSRRRISGQPQGRYVIIDPLIDYWLPIAQKRIDEARSKILGDLTAI